jgi:hypothetical protein
MTINDLKYILLAINFFNNLNFILILVENFIHKDIYNLR